MCVGWLVGKGDGVFITDLGVELEDDEFDDDLRRRTGDDIELEDDRGETNSGGRDCISGNNLSFMSLRLFLSVR